MKHWRNGWHPIGWAVVAIAIAATGCARPEPVSESSPDDVTPAGAVEVEVEGDTGFDDADAPWSIDRARVVFAARRGGLQDLYLLDRASGETTRLTRVGAADAGANVPRVSPDGRRLVFQLRRGQNYDLYLLDLAGGEPAVLVDHPDYDVSPVWSPDGFRVAFMSTRGFELGGIGPFPGHLYVMDAAGGDPRPITAEPLTSSLGPSSWAADGTRLLLARVTGERPDLFLLELESGRETRLTDTPEGEYSATFSHDGGRVACHVETADDAQIAILDLESGERRLLTAGLGWRYYPRWSPDDRWLLFTASDDGEQYDLRAVRVDDGEVIEILATPEDEREGVWLPR